MSDYELSLIDGWSPRVLTAVIETWLALLGRGRGCQGAWPPSPPPAHARLTDAVCVATVPALPADYCWLLRRCSANTAKTHWLVLLARFMNCHYSQLFTLCMREQRYLYSVHVITAMLYSTNSSTATQDARMKLLNCSIKTRFQFQNQVGLLLESQIKRDIVIKWWHPYSKVCRTCNSINMYRFGE